MTRMWAGFECARFEKWDNQDLLEETRHTPETDMTKHYENVVAHGIRTVRDGLPFHKDIKSRIHAAHYWDKGDDLTIWWDLVHFDPSRHLEDHVNQVKRLAEASREIDDLGTLHLCPVNEPSVWPMLTPHNRDGAIGLGLDIKQWCADQIEDVKFMTCDPVHHMHPDEVYATHRLCDSGPDIDLVGINYYPHETQIPLREILQWVHEQFPDQDLAITETSWHQGWAGPQQNWPHIRGQAGWLMYVMNEVMASKVPVQGICWYPWIDMPGWGERRGQVWGSGVMDLIR